MFEIELTKNAEKQLFKLDREAQQRLISAFERIRTRPYAHVKRLVGSRYYRLKTGPYRAILDIQKKRLIIQVIKIGHRKGIYKK